MDMSKTDERLRQRHKKRMKRIAHKARIYKYKEEEKKELEKYKPKRIRPSTSKVVLSIALIIGLQIIVFTEFVMYKYQNFSSLYSLIGIPATIVSMMGMILGYFNKSKSENTQGGVVYEQAMRQMEYSSDSSQEDVPVQNSSDTFNSKAD